MPSRYRLPKSPSYPHPFELPPIRLPREDEKVGLRREAYSSKRRLAVIVMLLVVLIAVGNFALGFALAVHLGQGPARAKWPTAAAMRQWIRAALRRQANTAAVAE